MAKKNKGEVSEFYAFVYILGNKVIELVDGSLKCLGQQVEFLKVFRNEDVSYEMVGDDKLRIRKNDSETLVDRESIRDHAQQLIELVKHTGTVQESDTAIQQLKTLLQTDRMTAKSVDKSDFSAEVFSPNQPHSQTLGFSVKSHIGSSPTLINVSGENSLLWFEILSDSGRTLTSADYQTLATIQEQWDHQKEAEKNGLTKDKTSIRSCLDLLRQYGYRLKFSHTCKPALDYTLRVIDSKFPDILGAVMLEHYAGKKASNRHTRSLSSLIDDCCVDCCDISCFAGLGETDDEVRMSVRYKMQNFLLAFSTGATVSKKWDGKDLANGGFIVVLKSGKVVCLELFTRNSIGQYLLENTKFETPSLNRHGGGRIVFNENKPLFGLQLQIRFMTN